MGKTTTSDAAHGLGWVGLSVAAAALMVAKPLALLSTRELQWMLGGIGGVMLIKTIQLLRSNSTSPWRLLTVVGGTVLLVILALVGFPREWMQLPSVTQIASALVPLVLFLVAVGAALVGIAQWNKKRELERPAQYSYLAVVLSAVIAVMSWFVFSQPIWKQSLTGLLQMTKVYENRMALEAGVNQWTDIIQRGESVTALAGGSTTGSSSIGPVSAIRPPDMAPLVRPPDVDPLRPVPQGTEVFGPIEVEVERWLREADRTNHDPAVETIAIRTLIAAGRTDEALTRVSRVRDEGHDAPSLTRLHAFLLQHHGDPAGAGDVLAPLVLSQYGADTDTFQCLNSLVAGGKSKRAFEVADRVRVVRTSRSLLRWLAEFHATQGQFDQALQTGRQLMARLPFEADDAYQFADIATRAGRPQLALDAVTALERAGVATPRTRQIAARAQSQIIAQREGSGGSRRL